MTDAQDTPRDFEAVEHSIDERQIDEAVKAGEMTSEQAAELLQQSARRQVAEKGPTTEPETEGTMTESGFGSGRGMEKQRTGQ